MRYYCDSCRGAGWFDIGDCEDGVTETCPECNGDGFTTYGAEPWPESEDDSNA